jgi:hypothetical protein
MVEPTDFREPEELVTRTQAPADAPRAIGSVVVHNGRPYEVVDLEPRDILVLRWLPRAAYEDRVRAERNGST